MKVLFVVTHLLGTGHLSRVLTLARAFQAAGHDVEVASGGMPALHLDRGDVPLIQLPSLRSDGIDFARLLDATGVPASEEVLQERADRLCRRLATNAPDVIITELFPFGRRVLRAEFLALLNAAHALPRRPLICASIRDILAPPSKPEKAARTEAILHDLYDAVLVHADPGVTALELSWPVSATLAPLLQYTGFVAPPPALPHPNKVGNGEIIVSAGGGNVGGAIFAAALAAARLSSHRWRLLVGGKDNTEDLETLRHMAPDNVVVEHARPDFRQLLHHAAASVSMCGYNTALDLMQSGCRAVLVPFDAGSEVEQTLRAHALAALPGITVLRNADLNGETLLNCLSEVLHGPAPVPMTSGFDGAGRTVQIVADLRRGMV
ncbi:MAG: glycosyltransferase [Sulfitobacter sp.]